MLHIQPWKIELVAPERLQIEWSDGQVRQYLVVELRENCPCASCREKRKTPPGSVMALPVISQKEAQPLRITQMDPAGRYAYAIHFSDGHDTGLFTLESLRDLGSPVS
ncbi:MAG: DUF971 domain-containing protein [Pirellulales bacterium]|nr:DUF971 domain-containing protein [Pirellulales bacterium]